MPPDRHRTPSAELSEAPLIVGAIAVAALLPSRPLPSCEAIALNQRRPPPTAAVTTDVRAGRNTGGAGTAAARRSRSRTRSRICRRCRSGVSAGRSPEVITAAYKFAAEHPEVLSYVPCFCGCERSGHRGNEDCFVEARAANGDVTSGSRTAWSAAVCIDVAHAGDADVRVGRVASGTSARRSKRSGAARRRPHARRRCRRRRAVGARAHV